MAKKKRPADRHKQRKMVRVRDEQHAILSEWARESGRTISSELFRILADEIGRRGKQPPASPPAP